MVRLNNNGGSGGGGTPLTVTDGVTTVTNTTEISFTNATVTNGGGGIADVLINSGSGSPGGLNTQIQYNNVGSFGGITGAVTDGTAVSLTAPHLLNPTINGAGAGLATLVYPNTASNATITVPATTGTLALTSQLTAGTVTNVSSADANATVATQTTTPVITIVSAPKLATGRTISITGDLAYTSPSFDGSGNITAAGTLASVITAGGPTGSATVAPIITYDAKGRLTAVTSATITPAVGSITGLGTGIATFLATPSSANLAAAVTDETGSGALVFATSPTLSNPIVGTQSPNDNSTKGASTAYVDAGVAAGIASVNAGDSVDYATSAILPNSPIYNNGASGVGATITTLTTNTALVVDGATPTIGQEVLVKNEGDGSGLGASRNGIYVLTTPASLGVAWILTRATDYNSANDINNLGLIYTRNGGTTGGSTGNAGISYALVARITTVGTDSITYQVGAPKASTIITNGGPLGTPSSGTGTNITGIPAANILAGTFGTGAYTMDTSLTVPQIFNVTNVITVTSNVASVNRSHRNNKVTNSSAAPLTINLDTTGAQDGDMLLVTTYDATAAAQSITWGNTENSNAVPSTNTNGSTTLPRTDGFRFNGSTSKYRCLFSS